MPANVPEPAGTPSSRAPLKGRLSGGSVATHLYLAVLLACLPAAGLLGWFFFTEADRAREQAYAEVTELAQETVDRLDRLIGRFGRILTSIAERPRVRLMDATDCDAILGDITGLEPGLERVTLLGASGKAVCPAGAPAAFATGMPAEMAGNDRIGVSVPVRDPDTGRWIAVVVKPLRSESGASIGRLVAAVDLAILNQRVLGDTEPGVLVTAIDPEGRVVLRSTLHEERVGQRNGEQFIRWARSGDQAPRASVGYDGIRRVYGSSASRETGWTVWSGRQEEAVLGPYRRFMAAGAIGFGTILVTTLLLIWRLSRRILDPMRGIASAAANIAEGGGDIRVPEEGPREIREVARQFNRMLDEQRRAEASLREREERHRLTERIMNEGIWELQSATGALYISPSWKAMLGYRDDELPNVESTFFDRVHPDDAPRMREAIRGHLEERAPYDFEMRLRHRDGRFRWVHSRGEALRDEEGKPCRMLGSDVDITERRQSEDLLRTRLRLSEIGKSGTQEELLQVALDAAEALTGSSIGFFHFVDADQVNLTLQAWSTHTRERMCKADGQGSHYPIDQAGVWVECFHRREPVIHNDYASLPGRKGLPEGHAPVQRELVVPIIRGGLVTEILGVGNKPSDYTAEDVEAVQLIASMVQDMVEMRRAEAALVESEKQLGAMIDTMPAMLALLDLKLRHRRVNARYEELVGVPSAGLVGRPVGEVLGEAEFERLQPRLARALTGTQETYEDWVALPGQPRRWMRCSLTPEWDAEGLVRGVQVMALDMTEQWEADARLRESEKRFEAIYQASPVAINIAVRAGGCIVDANDAALRLWGYRREEVLGRTALELGLFADLSQRDKVLEEARRRGVVDGMELKLRRRNGEERLIAFSARPVSLGGTECFIALSTDITDRHRREDTRLRSQKLESLGTLAGGIAHDFNNILSAIRGNAELAAEEVGPGHPASESLAEIRKAGVRASELVRRITAFGRPSEPQLAMLDLGAVVDEVLSLLRSTIPAGIALRTRFDGKAQRIRGDTTLVHEAVVNLTTNASYAIGPRTGEIVYEVAGVSVGVEEAAALGVAPGSFARLTVRDTGCGIDEAIQARIFDAYYTTKPQGEGSGLGLSMVYGVMKAHQGAVAVESKPGAGARFHLYFPVAPGEGEVLAPGTLPPPAARADRRVMLVDDERALVSMVSRGLARLGYAVTGFTQPAEALDAFRASPGDFDVVVTDLSMPGMSGFELVQGLCAIRADLAAVLTTGFVHPGDEERASAAGIGVIVPKPATVQDLARGIEEALAALNETPAAGGRRSGSRET